MINVDNISFAYAGQKTKVFDNFSLQLEANNIYGLLGKNGTGKSTLLYLISGLLRPQKGTVTVDGMKSIDRRPEMLPSIPISAARCSKTVSTTSNCPQLSHYNPSPWGRRRKCL